MKNLYTMQLYITENKKKYSKESILSFFVKKYTAGVIYTDKIV